MLANAIRFLGALWVLVDFLLFLKLEVVDARLRLFVYQ